MSQAFDKISHDPAYQALFLASTRRQFSKDAVVLAEGETPQHLYLLLSGSVSVRLQDWHGREALLAYLFEGDYFGEMCLLPGLQSRSAMVRTRSECAVLEIPYPRFLELTRQHSVLWLDLAGQLAARLRATNRRLAEMPMLQAAQRIWLVLSDLAAHDRAGAPPVGRQLRITREELGKLAGCTRELAGIALKAFAEEGRIRLSGQSIVLLDAPHEPRSAAPSPPRSVHP